eukprot:Sdes_comp20389_c0_seq3m14310
METNPLSPPKKPPFLYSCETCPYILPLSFSQMAAEYAPLRKYVSLYGAEKDKIDFTNEEALRCLTKASLKLIFGVDLNIPHGNLIPRVPQRMTFILFVQHLLGILPAEMFPAQQNVWGIDLGTGASCIYPILGFRSFGWNFLAVDCDENSIESSRKNILRAVLSSLESSTLPYFHFCMCNPPFFESKDQQNISFLKKSKPSCGSSPFAASHHELFTQGGEFSFVKGIIQDSQILKHKVVWYSTMLGKKDTFHKVLKCLQSLLDIQNIVFTTFSHGKTIRWAIAWTFHHPLTIQSHDSKFRPVVNAKFPGLFSHQTKEFGQKYSFEFPCQSLNDAKSRLFGLFNEMNISTLPSQKSDNNNSTKSSLQNQIRFSLKKNTWGRKYQRSQKSRLENHSSAHLMESQKMDVALFLEMKTLSETKPGKETGKVSFSIEEKNFVKDLFLEFFQVFKKKFLNSCKINQSFQ